MKRLLFCCFLLLIAACNRRDVQLEKTVTPVRLSTVELLKPKQEQRYSASILPNRQANLAFRVSGIVDEINQVRGADGRLRSVDIGDVVKQGTVLAQVRVKDYQLQVSQASGQAKQANETEQAARDQLAQAEAAATKAQQDFGRAEILFQKTSLTKSDYDSAKANYDSTRAQVEAARSQVQATAGASNTAKATVGTAMLGLHDTSLVAPFTGAVVQRSVELGSLAGPSAVAFALADISLVKASFGVSDIVIANLRSGSRMSVYTEAFPTREFEGFVSSIANVADSTTRSFQVEVTIPNQKSTLKPGMIASLDLGPALASKPVITAPLSAIVKASDASAGFAVVVVDEGIARRRPVTLGATYGDHIAISGVEAGKKVVSSGATFVSDGDAVRVIP